jgi:hypothetical protein
VAEGKPLVEIALIHSWLTAASDPTPPRVEAVGVGNWLAATVPLILLNPGCVCVKAPVVALKLFSHSFEALAMLCGSCGVPVRLEYAALEHVAAAFERSEQLGCVCVNAPVVALYEFNHSWETAASVCASVGSVLQVLTESERSPQAGWVADGTPLVEMALIHL